MRFYPAGERFHTDIGWLDSRHTFNFGEHQAAGRGGFRALRVINDDRVAGGAGFGKHPHRDMEILTYVIGGGLRHRDTLGNESVIRPGEMQRMSAGTGIFHEEFNDSETDAAHFLQIWLLPAQTGAPPGYEQKQVRGGENAFAEVVCPGGGAGALDVGQDAKLLLAKIGGGGAAAYSPAAGRGIFAHIIRGAAALNGRTLSAGDGVAMEGAEAAEEIRFASADGAEVLLFDLA